ncbi:MAG TPA: DEAD/DEAH box helicase [Bryobacteraceae bacterium]|nr:DEAD/DEAH box helicase [Bryobacteraceae bacterium]
MPETLPQFFERVTGKAILPYQARYASEPFTSTLLSVPTGLGKTDTVLIPWLYSVANPGIVRPPLRLVFTLPRCNLTEQVADIARDRIERAGLAREVEVLELMGGSSDNKRTAAPDRPTIIVGTQDILISRALNRGYARRPFRWPLDFALLNNDCLWIFDELQIMDDALATSTQLAAFREQFNTFGAVPCVWMSATVDPRWLRTVDFAACLSRLRTVRLDADDLATRVVQARLEAPKELSPAPQPCATPEGCAEFAIAQHRAGEMTLVIANTVSRARAIAQAMGKHGVAPLVLHSQFRQHERTQQYTALKQRPPEGRIIVSTQVIEAGIDISAHRMITDLAPWASLVQRFGRVNRYGELTGSDIWYVANASPAEHKDFTAPYTPDEIHAARNILSELKSASPADLPKVESAPLWNNVLRRADLLDLFDTSPDLSGNEIDVSRFVRSGDDRHCYVAWREWEGEAPPADMPRIEDRELCPAPIGELRDFIKRTSIFGWDFLERRWRPVPRDRCYPGIIAVAPASGGGYAPELGWMPSYRTAVASLEPENADDPEESFDSDAGSRVTYTQTLQDHTDMVIQETRTLLTALAALGLEAHAAALMAAAGKHDWGKAHPVMQETLHNSNDPEKWSPLLAKQERSKARFRHSQRFFRHELASALAMLEAGEAELAAYLAAAHHGRIRLTVRSMPGERYAGGTAVIRGIKDGQTLPAAEIGQGIAVPAVTLRLETAQVGSGPGGIPSWTERVVRLRDAIGPFRLAFLEMLLRIADERASEEAARRATCRK